MTDNQKNALITLTTTCRHIAKDLNEKKRKTKDDVWFLAILYRDIVEVENLLSIERTKMTKRNEQIKKYGIEIVEQDEKIWKDRGYTIDYDKDLLVKIKGGDK